MENNKKYDFIIVGAGFAGATCARLLTDKGYKCLILEERPFVSGNCATDRQNGIDIHFFGAHILHTNNQDVWEFLKTYGDIHEYNYRFIAWNNGNVYRIPYGMDLIYDIYHKTWPYEAERALEADKDDSVTETKTIKDYSLKYFGKSIYATTIKDFYEKMYNIECSKLSRMFMLESYNDNIVYRNSFYETTYQGVPEQGYVKLVESIIGDDIPIMLNTDFLKNKEKYMQFAKYIIYTGELDKFFNYCMGELDWIGVEFKLSNDSNKTNNLSGIPVVHFTDKSVNWYRMTEHKWLTPWRMNESLNDEFKENTYVTYEFYKQWEKGEETYYPLYTERSLNLYSRYLDKLHKQYPNVLLCGRKPCYNVMNICETIESAMKLSNKFPDKQSIFN